MMKMRRSRIRKMHIRVEIVLIVRVKDNILIVGPRDKIVLPSKTVTIEIL
jgi:hypothetical protein